MVDIPNVTVSTLYMTKKQLSTSSSTDTRITSTYLYGLRRSFDWMIVTQEALM